MHLHLDEIETMDIKKFLGTLVPSFTRQRIIEDIGFIRESLVDNTLPIFDSYSSFIGKNKLKSDYYKHIEERFDSNYKESYKGNIINEVYKILEKINGDLVVVERLSAKYYGDDVLKDAMSILRVNILQYLECINYIVKFSRTLLISMVAHEVQYFRQTESGSPVELEMLQGDVDYVENGLANFCACLNVVNYSGGKLEETLTNLPEVTISERSAGNVMATLSQSDTDPLKMNFIPVVLNPIYHVRIKVAEWQVRRFEASVEERNLLQFRLQQLKILSAGKDNASLDREITETQKRLDKLNYKIVRLEEEYGVS